VPSEQLTLDPTLLATLLAGHHAGVGTAGRATTGAGARRSLLSVFEWRAVLAVTALTQLVLAWPGEFLHGGHASAHLAHELSAWDIGLAVGFLFVAWRPARAWGMLPLVAVLVGCMTVTSAVDAASGHALLGREFVHALAVVGLGCTWMLARRVPRPSILLRVA
jgi:predicted anti-sigma-YlaC factor YlaD